MNSNTSVLDLMVWLVDLKGDSTDNETNKNYCYCFYDTFPMLWWLRSPLLMLRFTLMLLASPITEIKPLVVFGLPIFDLMVHLFMIFMIGRDSKNSAMNEK